MEVGEGARKGGAAGVAAAEWRRRVWESASQRQRVPHGRRTGIVHGPLLLLCCLAAVWWRCHVCCSCRVAEWKIRFATYVRRLSVHAWLLLRLLLLPRVRFAAWADSSVVGPVYVVCDSERSGSVRSGLAGFEARRITRRHSERHDGEGSAARERTGEHAE